MIDGYVVTTPANARALCETIARTLGYPRDGVTLSGEPTTEGMTTLYVEPRYHPTDPTRAAVPIDDVTIDLVPGTVVQLDATWEPTGGGLPWVE